jgi:GNAT superfamily N-acetyltransferase
MVAALAVVHGGTATATPEALGRDLLAPGADAWLMVIVGERTGGSLPEGYAVIYRTYAINHAKMEAFLAHLFVAPEARGHGLGAALLHSAREQAREWGCTTLQLRVDAENWNARRFYKSLGMTEKPHGRLRYMLVWLARTLGFKRHLLVEFIAPPLTDQLS